MKSFVYIIIFLGILSVNCAARPDYKDAHLSATSLLEDAEQSLKEGKVNEAAELIRIVSRLYPGDSRVVHLLEQLPPKIRYSLSESSYSGYNRPKGTVNEYSFLSRLAFYIPDRILDFLDIFSFNLKLGPQIGGSAWLTRGFQVTIYAGQTITFGWSQKRNLGIAEESLAEFGIGPAVPIAISARRVGTGQKTNIDGGFGLHTPTQQLYQDYRDYWSSGSKAGLIIIGAEFEWHWLEIADLITGVFFYDLLDDDIGSTDKFVFSDKVKKEMYTVNVAANKYNDYDIINLRNQFPTLGIPAGKPAVLDGDMEPAKKKK